MHLRTYRGTDPGQVHAYEPFKEDAADNGQQTGAIFKEDQLLIKMSPEALQSGKYESQSGLVPFAAQGVMALEPLIPNRIGAMGVIDGIKERPEDTWYIAELQTGTDVLAAASAISSQPGVLAAEPDYIRTTMADGIPDTDTDDRIGQQWHLDAAMSRKPELYEVTGIDPGEPRCGVLLSTPELINSSGPDCQYVGQ